MKGILNYIKNIFNLRGLLAKDLSSSIDPSLVFIKENIRQRIITLKNNIDVDNNLDLFKQYAELFEILERLTKDNYLEAVGFRFKTNSKYSGDIEIEGEVYEEWQLANTSEDDQILNRILIEQSLDLIKQDKKKFIKIIKKIIDEKF